MTLFKFIESNHFILRLDIRTSKTSSVVCTFLLNLGIRLKGLANASCLC